MPNETEDYNNAVRAALPSGMTFSGDRYRYNNHSFSPYKLAAWYYYYILRTGGAFSPSSLFAASEQGVWYDPSDLTTLFTDTAGTTPVTATGQTVGLMLDKSKGLVLGSELVTNGTFDSGITGWTSGLNSPVLSWVPSGAMRVSRGATAGFSVTTQSISGLVVGKTYLATAEFSAIASGLSPYIAINSVVSGTNRAVFRATATSHTLEVVTSTGSTGQSFDVDNISVKELAGNHATQATTASRPTYGINPITGRRNLLTRTEEFDNAAWVKFGVPTVPATQYLAPDGTTTAESIVFSGSSNDLVQQDLTGLPPVLGVTFTFSLWLRCASGTTTIRFGITQPTVIDYNTVLTVTTDWQRFTITQAFGSAGTSARVRLFNNDVGTTGTVFAWGAQLELGSTATAYQRVTDQYNVTEAGVASAHYLRFDGTDDFMLTNTITPAIDKVQVFAGVRKLSDAAQGTVAEFSAAVGSNNGSFLLAAPDGATTTFGFDSKGTAQVDAVASAFTAPLTGVVSALANIAGDTATIRVNGVQVDQDTADQGTGNYLAYPLYIGRRGGTTLSFNGQLYSLIVRFGANLTTDQITSTETYVNGKTGAYT